MVQPREIDWTDLRYVLVLAQQQSMVNAAHALRVHQTTISRRIVALEEQLGARLFDRIEGRFVPTVQGRLLMHRAQEMQAAYQALDGDLHHDTSQGRAQVRLSVIQTYVTGFLARHLTAFSARHPDIQLELICENRASVIERREADIAIRYLRPEQGHALVRKIGSLGTAAYANRSLLKSKVDWRQDLPWVGFAQVSDRWPEFGWMQSNVPAERVALTVNGGPALTQMVTLGYGAGLLTCIEGDALPSWCGSAGMSRSSRARSGCWSFPN